MILYTWFVVCIAWSAEGAVYANPPKLFPFGPNAVKHVETSRVYGHVCLVAVSIAWSAEGAACPKSDDELCAPRHHLHITITSSSQHQSTCSQPITATASLPCT